MKTLKIQMKTLKIMKWMVVAVALWSLQSDARWVYQFPDGESVGYWDDAERWTNDSGTHAVPTTGDGLCTQPGTIYITNSVPYIWQFRLRTPVTGNPLLLHFKEGAEVAGAWDGLMVGYGANEHGIVQIDAGATYSGVLVVGNSGSGVVTNQGTIKYSGEIQVGKNAGSTGRLVCCDGGAVKNINPKDLYVGRKGRGELVVTNSTFYWYWWAADGRKIGDVVVGESSVGGAVTVEEGGRFEVSQTYLGGRDAGAAGVGELVLRGGSLVNMMDNGSATMNLHLGTCPTADGGFDSASRGVIRGWGEVLGGDGSRINGRGIRMSVVSGEIVGDGEEDESHVLNACAGGLCLVSNAVPTSAGETTAGWRAVNKGLVTMPAVNVEWNGDYYSNLVGYPGCALAKDVDGQNPDLVNALRVRLRTAKPGSDKSIGVALLAPDRTDAYTNALPAGCNVLSVHRVGVFGQLNNRVTELRSTCGSANVAIRYDQTKIQKDNTRLQLWRYVAADGKWHRLVSLNPGERPSSKVIAMADDASVTGNLDELYNLGTFAVVERTRVGTAIIIR